MQRKVIKQGNGSYTITLPKKWVEENGISQKNVLDFEYQDNKLLIASGEFTQVGKSTKIKVVGELETSIRTQIVNLYRTGFDKISIEYSSQSQFFVIQKILQKKLIGFEMSKSDEKNCVIENITEPSSDKFETILLKFVYSIQVHVKSVIQYAKKKSYDDFENMQNQIQKYENFLKRVISKEKYFQSSSLYWIFLTLLLHAQRELYHLLKEKRVIDKVGLDILVELQKIVDVIQKSYLKKDLHILDTIHKLNKNVLNIYTMQKKISLSTHRILASARKFYQANSPLNGLILEEQLVSTS